MLRVDAWDCSEAKGVKTFGDLVDPEWSAGGDPKLRCRLRVIASDITEGRMLVLPDDIRIRGRRRRPLRAGLLGIAGAVRMSMSFPFFFEPVNLYEPRERRRAPAHQIVDGGILSNFPVWLFDVRRRSRAGPTFGLMLFWPAARPSDPGQKSDPDGKPDPKPGLIDFGKSLVDTMIEAHDRMYLEKTPPTSGRSRSPRSASAPPSSTSRRSARSTLYESGRAAAAKFLADWKPAVFEALQAAGEDAPGRRELLDKAIEG